MTIFTKMDIGCHGTALSNRKFFTIGFLSPMQSFFESYSKIENFSSIWTSHWTASIREQALNCELGYNEDQLSILDTTRSRTHLTLLEASYIRVRRPNLCKQKQFVYTLNLFNRLQAVAKCPIKNRVTISHFIDQRSIASRTSEIADKYHSLL